MSDHSDGVSVVFDEANPDFQDVFATKKTDFRPGTSKQHKHYRDEPRPESLPHHTLPKIHFPKFDGS